MMIRKTLILFFVISLSLPVFSQRVLLKFPIDTYYFNDTLLSNALLERINNKRASMGFEELMKDTTLQKAAKDQAQFMSEEDLCTLEQSKNKKTTADRILFYGGSGLGNELVDFYKLSKKNEAETYRMVVEKICDKWFRNSKKSKIIFDKKALFVGVKSIINSSKTKIYISFLIGDYQLFLGDLTAQNQLANPLSTKAYRLKPYDNKICRKIDQQEQLSLLQNGISQEGNIIYFSTDQYKQFKKMFRKERSGVAIDIVQKKQYLSDGQNIINSETPWKGILHKPIYADDFDKENLIEGKDAKYQLKIPIAFLDKTDSDSVEYNLLIIQEQRICANIAPNYTLPLNIPTQIKATLLADTITINNRYDYSPQTDTNELVFKVPFKKNQYSYRQSDIEPIIKSLDEPNFKINEIEIWAYSSIEGSEQGNKQIQIKRAESIEKALKTYLEIDRNISKANVNIGENWSDFQKDVKNTEFAFLSEKTLKEAQEIIKQKGIESQLESILEKHRYSKVRLKINYQFPPKQEAEFVLKRFNKSIQNNDKIKALAIQKYIFKQVLNQRYGIEVVLGQNIPQSPEFAGLKMNQYWLMNYYNQDKNKICEQIEELYRIQPQNMYIQFNQIFCQIQHSDWSKTHLNDQLQTRIEDLYKTNLPESTIDALYLDFLFQLVKQTQIDKEQKQAYLEKIKTLADVEDMNLQNAKKMAQLFINQQDYAYALETLSPFVELENPQEDIVFTYISLCTHFPQKIQSHRFYIAVKIALKLNANRFKKLLENSEVSFQIFDNLRVKKLIQKKHLLTFF